MITEIIDRNGRQKYFDISKISTAIEQANLQTCEIMTDDDLKTISNVIANNLNDYHDLGEVTISDIEYQVFETLTSFGYTDTARAYEGYRSIQEFKRQTNTNDDDILGILSGDNKEVLEENANKITNIISTQRDLISGEVSKDIALRKMIPSNLVDAHNQGVIHIHDLDYFIQPMFNCCLINMEDMLSNGTVINDRQIKSPNSFQTACNVATQIVAQVSSSQYGGQSFNVSSLSSFLAKSHDRNYKMIYPNSDDEDMTNLMVEKLTEQNLKDGVQTIQYQINTLMTTNGQSPFVTIFMYLSDDDPYYNETEMIIEEILRQRIEGMENEIGVKTTPTFPKLVLVLNENTMNGDNNIMKLATECVSKRMYPDFISEKKMKELYDGQVFSPMGCRSFLSVYKDEKGEHKTSGRFNIGVQTINLPQIAILSQRDEKRFFNLLNERLELIYEMGKLRLDKLKGTLSDVSPIHWQHGAIARLDKGENIDKFLTNGYATTSIGYIGLYEASYLITGNSHTGQEGKDFALKVMETLNRVAEEFTDRVDNQVNFSVYGTPAESLTDRFSKIDKERFGNIYNVTDKGFYTNSFHVDVREEIDVFSKFNFESTFQKYSLGGSISYAEIPNMKHNLLALEDMIRYIYDNILYAEFNTKTDLCHKCKYDGEILLDDNSEWYCPNCNNKDESEMTVVRRVCGYLSDNYFNEGRTEDIKNRVLHI